MTKEKLASLNKELSKLKDRLSGAVPPKHAGHPDPFKAFLKNEIRMIESKLEEVRLQGATDKK